MKKTNRLEYKIKLSNDFTEPYMYGSDLSNIAIHRTTDEYVVYNEKTFYDALDEFLDAPKSKLSEKDIHKDFDSKNCILSDAKAEVIKEYYNGRYELSKKIYAKLKKIDFSKIDPYFPIVMKFKIPFHMNFFSCEDNDPYDKCIKMNDAYIEIEISKPFKEI